MPSNGRIWIWFLVFIFTTNLSVFCQTVQIINKSTQKGIEGVLVYNLNNYITTQSDANGFIELSEFSSDDMLTFQHFSYYTLTLSYNSLLKSKHKIELEEKIIRIKEIVISASKWEQETEDIPNTIQVISPQEIKFNNLPTTADVLSKSGQVFVQKSQQGGGSPMIRGFGANSILIVLDGVRMNNAIYRGGNVHNVISIDANSLEQAEVLFGPGSVMYGSDALGGVMDFHTFDPLLSSDRKITSRFNTLLRYSSAANELTSHFDLNLGGRKISSFTNLTYSYFDDLVTGSKRTTKFPDYGKRPYYVDRINERDTFIENPNENKQVFSGYEQTNLLQKIKYRPSENLDLIYAFHFSYTSDVPRYDRLIEYDDENNPVNARWYYYPQQWMMHSLSTTLYKSTPVFDKGRLILSYQNVLEGRNDRKFQDNFLRTRDETVDIMAINLDLDKTLQNHQQLFYGLEFAYNNVQSTAFRRDIVSNERLPAVPRYPDGGSEYSFLAVSGSYLREFSDKINFTAGARYTQTWLQASTDNTGDLDIDFNDFSMSNGALNGNIGLVYKPDKRYKLDLLLSSGFRAPNVDDVGKLFDSEPGKVIVPNENLNPEYSYNIETGITRNINHALQLHAVGFYTLLKGAMVRRDYTLNGRDSLFYNGEFRKIQALTNTGKANIYGFSILIKGNLTDHWSFLSSLNYTKGQDLIEDIPLRHSAPLFGITSIIYNHQKWKVEFFTQYSGGKIFDNMAPSEQNKPHLYTSDGALSWYTLNLKGSWSPAYYLTLDAGLENMLDKHYRPYSSGISAPGRNLIITLRFNI